MSTATGQHFRPSSLSSMRDFACCVCCTQPPERPRMLGSLRPEASLIRERMSAQACEPACEFEDGVGPG